MLTLICPDCNKFVNVKLFFGTLHICEPQNTYYLEVSYDEEDLSHTGPIRSKTDEHERRSI